MTRLLLAPVLGALLLGAAFLPGDAHAAHNDHLGFWVGIDSVDGSFQMLTIGPGANPRVLLIDLSATVACPTTEGLAAVSGRGTIDGDTLTVDPARVRCPSEGTTFDVTISFTAQPDGTLIDFSGNVWYRIL